MSRDSPRREAVVHADDRGRETVAFVAERHEPPEGVLSRLRRAVGGDGRTVERVAVAGPAPVAALERAGVDPAGVAGEAALVLPADPDAARDRLAAVADAGLREAFDRVVSPVGRGDAETVGTGERVGPARVVAADDPGSLAVAGPDGDGSLVHYERRAAGERAVGERCTRNGETPPGRSASASAGGRRLVESLRAREPLSAREGRLERVREGEVTTLATPERFDRIHVHDGTPERVVVHETDATDRPAVAIGRYAGEAVADLPVDEYEWVPGSFDDPTAADHLSAARAAGLLLPAPDGAVRPDARGFAAALAVDRPVTPVGDGAELHDDRVNAAATPGRPLELDFGVGDERVRVAAAGAVARVPPEDDRSAPVDGGRAR